MGHARGMKNEEAEAILEVLQAVEVAGGWESAEELARALDQLLQAEEAS